MLQAHSPDLYSLHRINELLSVREYRNGELLSVRKNVFKEVSPDLLLLDTVKSGKFNATSITSTEIKAGLEPRIVYHRYDDYGNPLEVSQAGGAHISYIWGYNQSLPVAKVVNATFGDIEGILGLDFHSGAGGLTPSQESLLRTGLPEAQVTTYAYEPLKGVASVTDPRGYTTHYDYDEFSRLKHIQDDDLNVLKTFDYHYRPLSIDLD